MLIKTHLLPIIKWPALLLSCLVYLSACSTHTDVDDGITRQQRWNKHKRQLQAITHYQVNGSFAYRSNKTKHYVRFIWQQKDNKHYQLQITSPLGNKLATISITPQKALYTDQNGDQYEADNAQALLTELTGIVLPLIQFNSLLLGLTDQKVLESQLTKNGYLKSLTLSNQYQGWQINYTDYFSKKRPALPAKIKLSQDDNDIDLKLTLNKWTQIK